MSEYPASSDWAAARGEKWRDQLSGMEAMLAPVDEPLVRALELDSACRIADIGSGGGGTTRVIADRAPAGSVIHGFDISAALIESARSNSQRASQVSPVDFMQANVATASVPDELYHRLVSRFGIMFFDDPLAAFTNLARWLAPGGRFAFAVWGPPAENPWVTSIREVISEAIDLPSPEPDAPGPFRYAGAEKLLSLLDSAGLADFAVHDWHGALPLGGGLSAVEAARFALTSFSIGQQVAEAGDQVQNHVYRGLTERFSRHEQDGIVWMGACVHIVTGSR